MEAGALADELHEHRDGAVRLRRGNGEQPVGDLALHHHAPAVDRRQPVEALDEQRRRDVVRQVRDELRRVRRERGEVEPERVAEVERDVRARVAQVRLERRVELDRVHVRDALREVAREHAETRADLEHDVVGREIGEAADHAEDVLVDEEVLAELLLRDAHAPSRTTLRDGLAARVLALRRRPQRRPRNAHLSGCTRHAGRPKHSAALRRSALELRRLLPARLRERRERVHDVRGLVRAAAHRLRREVGAVGLGEDPVGGHLRRGEPQVDRLRERRVAGERDVPAALEGRLEQAAARRSSAGRRGRRSRRAPRACRRRRRGCGSRPACRSSAAIASCRANRSQLRVARRVVAEPVEARLADRDGLRVVEQPAHLGDVGVGRAAAPRAGGCRGSRRRRRARPRARARGGSRPASCRR